MTSLEFHASKGKQPIVLLKPTIEEGPPSGEAAAAEADTKADQRGRPPARRKLTPSAN